MNSIKRDVLRQWMSEAFNAGRDYDRGYSEGFDTWYDRWERENEDQ